jgi:hypothetical protein
MFGKKLGVRGEQARVQNFENTGKVNFRVFCVWVIAVDQEGGGGEGQQGGESFNVQKESLLWLRICGSESAIQKLEIDVSSGFADIHTGESPKRIPAAGSRGQRGALQDSGRNLENR